MASVATYAGYQFADNEVNLVSFSKTTRYSPRNRKMNVVKTIDCQGELIYSDTATIVTKIQALEAAFDNDNGDFRYTVGGTLAHSLLNGSDCITGVKVIQRPSFPKGDPAQLATTRTFSFRLQATYDSSEDDLVSWNETMEVIGTGGPKFFVVETVLAPYTVYLTQASAQYIQQSGSAVGYTQYPVPPGPVSTGTEFLDRRRIIKSSARQMGNGLRFYPIRWSYFMVRDPTNFGSVDFTPTSK